LGAFQTVAPVILRVCNDGTGLFGLNCLFIDERADVLPDGCCNILQNSVFACLFSFCRNINYAKRILIIRKYIAKTDENRVNFLRNAYRLQHAFLL
jgi:hypothetical protein